MAAQIRISFEAHAVEEVPAVVPAVIPTVIPAVVAAEASPPELASDDPLPPLHLHTAGYEMYRDDTRTVLRKPGDRRWTANVRLGPLSHRYVGGGEDPEALWAIAARARREMNL